MPLAQRDVNTPQPPKLQTPPAQKTPQVPSRVPVARRAVTPNSAPSRPQWSSRVAGRVASTEKNADQTRSIQRNQQDSVTITPYQSHTSTQLSETLDKPLPSRPIAQLPNLESPSRDSRVLIDASEQPLETSSPSGTRREWPALTPTPVPSTASTPTTQSEPFESREGSSKDTPSVTPASVVAAAAELTNVITGTAEENDSPASRRRSLSSASAYESANESSIMDGKTFVVGPPGGSRMSRKVSTPDSSYGTPPLWNRTDSLRNRRSSGSLIPQVAGSTRKLMTLTDFSRDNAPSPALTDSRPHSPSPASFSRPRLGSGAFRTPTGSIEAMKTASRLPIPDSKKPTIVDVKPRDSQHSYKSSKSTQQPPTFGNRRLDSKTADILDNGIKRRQLQRTRTNEGYNKPAFARAPTDASDAPTLGTSAASVGRGSGAWSSANSEYHTTMKSDEGLTYAPSSSGDESEVTTPLDGPIRFSQRFNHTAKPANAALPRLFDTDSDEKDASYGSPPPTSPFSAPLPTIPSEPALPVRSSGDEEKITQTLSHLEGRGSPPKRNVDDKAVMKMFGHIRSAFDAKTTHNTSMFLGDAAAAERYLALPEDSLMRPENMRGPSASIPHWAQTEQLERAVYPGLEPAVSKWSDTTPSEKGTSEEAPRSPNVSTSQDSPKEPSEPPPPPPPPKDHARSHESIGYPSRVPATPEILTSSLPQTAIASVPDIARRPSSPTLASNTPSSSRAAREGVKTGPAGFARTTQAAEARKTSRLPTPSAKNTRDQRGRQVTPPKQSGGRESEGRPKSPRARSKSRYMFDKLNGLFSGKRDKKSIAIPPVPRIKEVATPPSRRMTFAAELEGSSTAHLTTKVPPAPRIPSPPQLAAGPDSKPSMTTLTFPDDRTLVDFAAATAMPAAPATPAGATAPATPAATTAPASPPRTDNFASILDLTERMVRKARCETSMMRKSRLLKVAQALNDSMNHAREAQISAETAEQAAYQAQMHCHVTLKTLELLQKLAVNVGRVGAIRF